MKVPYSMDDSEPDLYGGLGGHHSDDWETQTKWEGDYIGGSLTPYVKPEAVFTQEEMTKVIQHNLKVVHEYRNEIEELLGLLSYIYNHSETLPQGVSQQIREQITMERIWEKNND